MGDASNLRVILSRTDNGAMSIQSSAGAMMKLYDVSPSMAVTEWRNCLQNCRVSQLLPLLYVANEVLQTSKRNRGNRFLEAYCPVLSQSLQYACERDRNIVEKVRRMAKIWGDRRVFSVRFVGELLGGLERFRSDAGAGGGGVSGGGSAGGGGGASAGAAASNSAPASAVTPSSSSSSGGGGAPPRRRSSSSSTNGGGGGGGGGSRKSKSEEAAEGLEEEEDDEDPFGSSAEPLLRVDVNIDSIASAAAAAARTQQQDDHSSANADNTNATNNRLTSPAASLPGSSAGFSTGSTPTAISDTSTPLSKHNPSNNNNNNNRNNTNENSISSERKKKRPRVTIQSAANLSDLFHRVAELNNRYRHALSSVQSSLQPLHLNKNNTNDNDHNHDDLNFITDDVVGDELISMNNAVINAQKTIATQRRQLHHVASELHHLEHEATGYISWLRTALHTDQEELQFCQDLERRISTLQFIHEDARLQRQQELQQEAQRRALEEAERHRLAEEADRRRSLEDAMNQGRVDVKPGMVWNKNLREYQYLHDHTEGESWRD